MCLLAASHYGSANCLSDFSTSPARRREPPPNSGPNSARQLETQPQRRPPRGSHGEVILLFHQLPGSCHRDLMRRVPPGHPPHGGCAPIARAAPRSGRLRPVVRRLAALPLMDDEPLPNSDGSKRGPIVLRVIEGRQRTAQQSHRMRLAPATKRATYKERRHQPNCLVTHAAFVSAGRMVVMPLPRDTQRLVALQKAKLCIWQHCTTRAPAATRTNAASRLGL